MNIVVLRMQTPRPSTQRVSYCVTCSSYIIHLKKVLWIGFNYVVFHLYYQKIQNNIFTGHRDRKSGPIDRSDPTKRRHDKQNNDNSVENIRSPNSSQIKRVPTLSREGDTTPNTKEKKAWHNKFSLNQKKFIKNLTREGFRINRG